MTLKERSIPKDSKLDHERNGMILFIGSVESTGPFIEIAIGSTYSSMKT